MRIGVDTRSLSEPISGIGRYTLSLLELMVLDKSNEWVLYSHRPILHKHLNMKNVTVRTLSLPKWVRGIYMPWSQLILPYWAKQDDIDIFWSPAHRLPIFLSKSISLYKADKTSSLISQSLLIKAMYLAGLLNW